MTPWVSPIDLDPTPAEQRYGDLAIGCPGQPSVERLQNDAQPSSAGFGWEMTSQQPPGDAEIVEGLNSRQMCPDVLGSDDGIGE